MQRFAIIAFLTLLYHISADAQRLSPKASFLLNADYARFSNGPSSGYLELYYAFYPGLITADRQDDGSFKGWIRVWTRLRETSTGNLLVNDLNAIPIVIRDTSQRSSTMTTVSQVGYAVPFGSYSLEIVAFDSLASGRSDSLRLPIEIKSFAGTAVSDLQLCSSISEAKGSGSFIKNSLEVIPNATLLFGVTSHPVLFQYSEIYGLEQGHQYALRTSIVDAKGVTARQSTRMRTFSNTTAVDIGTTNVSALPSGRYTILYVVLKDTVEEVASSRKTFYVHNPHVQILTPSATSMKASELAGLTFEELGVEFDAAKYVATEPEISGFQRLSTADARREFLARFWASVEQGRNGLEDISRASYLQRVVVANQKYRVHGREGWRTDRGRVALLYGDPDETERTPSDEGSKPYEIWHYYRIENGVQFIFVDRTGFGDYVLVHSTKRGELQDDSWQRLLR